MKKFSVNEVIKARRGELFWDKDEKAYVVSDGAFAVMFTDDKIFNDFQYKCKDFTSKPGTINTIRNYIDECTELAWEMEIYFRANHRMNTAIIADNTIKFFDKKYTDLFRSAICLFLNKKRNFVTMGGENYIALICGVNIPGNGEFNRVAKDMKLIADKILH